MEKIAVGLTMCNSWSDPPMVLIHVVAAGLGLCIVPFVLPYGTVIASLIAASFCIWYHFVYHKPEPADTLKYLVFRDKSFEHAWATRKIYISLLWQMYIEGKVEFKGSMFETLRDHRYEFVNFKMSFGMMSWLLGELIPGLSSSFKDKASTKKEIADHYDRGNDFFEAFMGPSMVYTSGVFRDLANETLEQAQDNKMRLICEKLQLQKGKGTSMLDIGCGWGTLCRFAAKNYEAKVTGVTLSVEGAAWCNDKAREHELEDKVSTVTCDYRDIPEGIKFPAISSIEMAEHVGISNFQVYLSQVKRLLEDDGLFLMQVAGLRQGATWEDLMWGLFMSRYIFPGADASTPLHWYTKQLEMAGFEVHSVETIGRHYSHTLHRWLLNLVNNRAIVTDKYGSHLFRLYEFFLAYAAVQAGVGTATCYQILVHKNTCEFPRDIWCGEDGVSDGSTCRETGVGLSLEKVKGCDES